MESYYVKPKIYMDREGLREILKGVSRAFIVTDRFMHESGKVSYLSYPMDQMGISYEIFSEIRLDPDIATLTLGVGRLSYLYGMVVLTLPLGNTSDAWPA